MKLKKIIGGMDNVKKVEGKVSLEIRSLMSDSKAVREGDIFFALKGAKVDGAMFIDEAIDRGAYAVVLDRDAEVLRKGACFIYVDDTRNALAEACRVFYGDVSRKMRLVGVTGTNGKTTIAYLLESLFKAYGESSGLIGTINYRFGKRVIPAINTTPGILDIYSLLHSMHKEKIQNCIMEVSSHSLKQKRVETLEFDLAIFTNLTREHLDYHKTMDDYLESKLMLFSKLKKDGWAIVNKDDTVAEKIIERVKCENKAKIMTYGIKKDADIVAGDIKSSFNGLTFRTVSRLRSGNGYDAEIRSRLIGRHNVYNILAVICAGLAMGIEIDTIKQAIELVQSLPGRLESIDSGKGFSVYVDYAHTEDGLEQVLKALRELRPHRILSVFGCGGDRDTLKRPVMGKIASELSDRVFITSDNPRSEEPMDIIKEIVKGVDHARNNYVIEPDRFSAIKKAIQEAAKGDIVLVAGKGHETYQIFKNVTLPFDDREAVRKILHGG